MSLTRFHQIRCINLSELFTLALTWYYLLFEKPLLKILISCRLLQLYQFNDSIMFACERESMHEIIKHRNA